MGILSRIRKGLSPSLGKKTSIYLDSEGRPKTIIATGRASSGGLGSSTRSESTLKSFWEYYENEGTIFAAINTTAWNTVMVGYNLVSENDKAKNLMQRYLDKLDFDLVILDNVIYALVYGDAFIEIVKNSKGQVTDLKTVDPVTVVINTNEYGDVEGYQQKIQGIVQKTVIKPEDIIHIKFFSKTKDSYGISLIQPSRDTLDRKIATDQALANAIIRHGTPKYKVTVGTADEFPPESVFTDIKAELEDITEINEIIVPGLVNIESLDEKGIPGVEEYSDTFQTQLIIGLLCPEEALGMGKGSTEACYDDKTETLTKNGWKRYSELKNDDEIATYNPKTSKIEYKKPLDPVDKHIYEHKGPMIKFKSQKLDMLVTPNHRMFVNKNPTSTKENWEIVTAEEIYNSNSHWAIKSKVKPEDYKQDFPPKQPIIDLMKFIGYFVSEGSINSEEPYCRLSQKKEDSAHRMREVIYSNYPEFKESYSEDKGYEWHWYNKELYDFLKDFGDNCYNRHIPRQYLEYQPEYLKYLLFSAIDGDGTYDTREGRNTCEYTTTSKQLADDILEIAIKCGYRAHIIFSEDKRENRIGMWRVRIDLSEKDYVIITPEMCEKIYYEGKVHCLNVPNHIYLTRRNNKLAIQGNTATVKQMMYERMIRSFQLKIANQMRNELFNPILESYKYDPDIVKMRFNSVTDADEAVKAKWLGNLLRGYRPEEGKPFTEDEIRAMFGYGPKMTKSDDKKPKDEPEEKPEKPKEDKPKEEEDKKKDEELRKAQSINKKLQEEVNNLNKEVKKLISEKGSSDKEVVKYSVKLENMENNMKSIEEKNKSISQDKQKLQNTLNETKSKLNDLYDIINNQKDEMNNIKLSSKEYEKEINNDVNKYKYQIDLLEKTIEAKDQRLDELSKSKELLIKKFKNVASKIKKLNKSE